MQIERAEKTLPDKRGRPRLAHFYPFAKLPRQSPAPLHRQVSLARRLRDRADKNIFLDGGVIELSRGNPDPRAAAAKFCKFSAGPLIVG